MSNRISAYAVFYALGAFYWLISRNLAENTLLCVFYSIFVGTVWGLLPQISGTGPLSWKFLLPPFLLVILMMFSVSLRLVMSTEAVLLTAMSLIHLRAFVLSFTRLTKNARIFSWIQLASFVYGLVYLFQKNFLPFPITREEFLITIMAMSMFSIGTLVFLKRKSNNHSGDSY
jgi:hypothetical protein